MKGTPLSTHITNTCVAAQWAYLGGDQGELHALKVAALLAEDEVLLLGLGNDEVELQLLSQHGGAESEGVKGALGELKKKHACARTEFFVLFLTLTALNIAPHTHAHTLIKP